jgi:hypothetical protein
MGPEMHPRPAEDRATAIDPPAVPDENGTLVRAIVLVKAARFADVRDPLTAIVTSARPFVATPFYAARADDPGLGEATAIDGVLGVDRVDGLVFAVLNGIDWAVRVTMGWDDWAVGGVQPGEDYPGIAGMPTGTTAPAAVCAAVNVSLAPDDEHLLRSRAEDSVNHATDFLARSAVPVLPSGNHHSNSAGFETVSPWSEPAWVLCVGATADDAGDVEWERSARGTAARPDVMPDLLAWGQNPFVENDFGTTFAAARVSVMVALARAWLLQVAANVDRRDGRDFGVPLVGIAFIDKGFAGPPKYGPRQPFRALPFIASTASSLAPLEGMIDRLRDPASARVLVEAAARATSTAAGLSAPSITATRLQRFLDELQPSRLAALLSGETAVERNADDQPLFAPGIAERLLTLASWAMPLWEFDINSSWARMRPDGGGGE